MEEIIEFAKEDLRFFSKLLCYAIGATVVVVSFLVNQLKKRKNSKKSKALQKTTPDVSFGLPEESSNFVLENQDGALDVYEEADIQNFFMEFIGDEEQFIILTAPKPIENISFLQACHTNGKIELEIAVVSDGKCNLFYRYCQATEVFNSFISFYHGKFMPDVSQYQPVEFYETSQVQIAQADMSENEAVNVTGYKELTETLIMDATILEALDACFKDYKQYFRDHQSQYEDRGIDSDEDADTILWFAIVDCMLENISAVEVDWKDDPVFVAELLNQILPNPALHIEPEWLTSEYLSDNFEIINNRWKGQGYVLAALDIDSDSYVLTILEIEQFREVRVLADDIRHNIDCAQYI